jgi:predicted DCC family thiol-disulfide oxidoreductase YuxK
LKKNLIIKLPVLLFDAECTFCVRFTQGLKLVDKERRINYLPIQDESIYEQFETLTFEDCSETIHLVDEGRKILKGSEAIKFLVQEIPSVSKFSWLIESNSAQKAMDVFYGKVNEIRKVKNSKGCTNCGKRRSQDKVDL